MSGSVNTIAMGVGYLTLFGILSVVTCIVIVLIGEALSAAIDFYDMKTERDAYREMLQEIIFYADERVVQEMAQEALDKFNPKPAGDVSATP